MMIKIWLYSAYHLAVAIMTSVVELDYGYVLISQQRVAVAHATGLPSSCY